MKQQAEKAKQSIRTYVNEEKENVNWDQNKVFGTKILLKSYSKNNKNLEPIITLLYAYMGNPSASTLNPALEAIENEQGQRLQPIYEILNSISVNIQRKSDKNWAVPIVSFFALLMRLPLLDDRVQREAGQSVSLFLFSPLEEVRREEALSAIDQCVENYLENVETSKEWAQNRITLMFDAVVSILWKSPMPIIKDMMVERFFLFTAVKDLKKIFGTNFYKRAEDPFSKAFLKMHMIAKGFLAVCFS